MFIKKSSLAFAILLLCACTQNRFVSSSGNYIQSKTPIINKELIEKVDFIYNEENLSRYNNKSRYHRDKRGINCKYNLFFFFVFSQQNDSTFLRIGCDLAPPVLPPPNPFIDPSLIKPNEVKELGCFTYKKDFFIFWNEKVSHELINRFVEIKKLKKNLKVQNDRTMEVYSYVYYINEFNELIFVRKDW